MVQICVARIRAVLFVVVALLAAPAYAGPPFITDDPDPVDFHAWEVNYAVTGSHSRGSTTGVFPGIDANYGVAPGIQLHAQVQAAYSGAAGVHAYGVGDSELGIKYRLSPESAEPEDWMISVYPMYDIDTGNARRQLGTGASSVYLPLWVQKTTGAWTTYGGAGYRINTGAERHNAWAGGWVALYQISKRLQLGCEVFAQAADTTGERSASGFNLGGIYGLAKDWNLLFSAGRGLSNANATNQASAYLGLQVLY